MPTTSCKTKEPPTTPYCLATSKVFCNFCPAYCCYRLKGSTLYITSEDINRIARYFKIADGEVRRRFLEGKNTFKTREDGSCLFLSNRRISKRCTIHTARPKQCRDFPFDKPCPYLEREDLLETIEPLIVKGLGLDTTFKSEPNQLP
jgi:uncharacterized protein